MLRGDNALARKIHAKQTAQINALTKRVEQLEKDQTELVSIVRELASITNIVGNTASQAYQWSSMSQPLK